MNVGHQIVVVIEHAPGFPCLLLVANDLQPFVNLHKLDFGIHAAYSYKQIVGKHTPMLLAMFD